MRKNILITILLSLVLQSAAFANNPKVKISRSERRMASAITAEQLSDYLYFIASDAMGGRNTPSAGLDITAQFIALNLKKWGFKPAGDNGTFFQRMTVNEKSPDIDTMSLKIGNKSFSFGKDFLRFRGSGKVKGKLVFGRHGWMVKSKGIDPLKEVDVKDKIIVMHQAGTGRFPNGVTPEDLKGKPGIDWADPLMNAQSKGAKGIITIAGPSMESQWEQVKRFSTISRFSVDGLGRGVGSQGRVIPTLIAKGEVAKAILAGESGDQNSSKAFELKKHASINVVEKIKSAPTQNVVAVWEGRDPKLKHEMVAVGAHYDHEGTKPNAKGEDKIWNGADDDGSGTVAVLAIAEALAKAKKRPKRSVLLVWHAGEEKGLWGSEYFNKYPTVNIKNVVAQLNIDMIGRSKKAGDTNPRNKELSGPNEIYLIGAEMMSSTLGTVTKATNNSYLKMKYNYRYDDPKDPNRFFFRSDHFSYAQNGIPVVFWFDGEHQDYHEPSDHPDKIDYRKLEKVTRTIFLTAWELAQLRKRPAIDKKLPPELTQGN